MNTTFVNIIVIIIFIVHLILLIVGYKIKKSTLFISYLNIIITLGVLIFWCFDFFSTKKNYTDIYELYALAIEVCILLFSLYAVLGFYTKTYVKIITTLGFIFHLLVSTAILTYMFSFKFTKLF